MTVTAPPGFSWDCRKYESNIKKHWDVRFDVAIRAFADPYGFDCARKIENDEERFSYLGLVGSIVHYIVYGEWTDETLRIISARKAHNDYYARKTL